MPYLLAISGPDSGKRYDLALPKYVLGRHPDCDIVVDSGAVSRYHAQLIRVADSYHVEDLKSRNGTFLNDVQIPERRPLANGDTIRVCDIAFTFHHVEATKRFAPPDLSEGSGFASVLVDDDARGGSSTIMSKLDVASGGRGGIQLRASAEAKLRALIEITQSLGKKLALDEVLPEVLNSLFKIFVQADRGFIVLREAEGRLVPRWTKVRRGDETTLRISRTIVNQVIASKEAVLSADAATDSRFELSQSIADFRIRSMMCAPLLDFQGESFGVLQIDTLDQRSRFQEDDLEVLVSVAAQAGIAINNAQLYEQALRQQSLARDLELAHQVQRGFLPSHPPRLAGYEFFDYYQPANHIGGDYYDYLYLPDGRVAIVVADVVGHGVAAALLMAKLSAEVRFCLASISQPSAAVTQLNDALVAMNLNDRFVTLVMAVLEPKTHTVTVVNAGHNSVLLRRANGKVDEPGAEVGGLPLGIVEGFAYQQHTFKVGPGEMLVLYTDGISEAMNDKGDQFSVERMKAKAKETAGAPIAYGKGLIDEMRRWIGPHPQNDDMCLVVFTRADTRNPSGSVISS